MRKKKRDNDNDEKKMRRKEWIANKNGKKKKKNLINTQVFFYSYDDRTIKTLAYLKIQPSFSFLNKGK